MPALPPFSVPVLSDRSQFSEDDKSAASAVQFAVQNLHVSYVFVVGHTQCGGVAAALRAASSDQPRNAVLGDWLGNLTALAKDQKLKYPDDLAELIEMNITDAMNRVGHFVDPDEDEATVYKAGESKSITIVGLEYNLETGRLREVGQRILVQALQRKVTPGFEECSEVIDDSEGTL